LSELRIGADKIHSLRGPLCSLILLGYNTMVTYILGKSCMVFGISAFEIYFWNK